VRPLFLRGGALLVLLLALLAAPALAADPSVWAPYRPRGAAIVTSTWTGCYIGVNGGGAWGRTRTSGNWLPPGTTLENDIDGGFVGGQVGCDYQIQNNWVIGAEATGDWASIRGSVTDPFNTQFGHVLEHRVNGFATFTGRLGYAQDKWLVYAKGGAAWANMDYISHTTVGNNCGPGPATCTVNGDKWGWTIGGGLEYML